MRKLYWASKH